MVEEPQFTMARLSFPTECVGERIMKSVYI